MAGYNWIIDYCIRHRRHKAMCSFVWRWSIWAWTGIRKSLNNNQARFKERMLSLFFSMFYFSINAGSMISTFISPIFRSMPCMGQDSCYPMAFGIPACLMILATCKTVCWNSEDFVLEGVFMAGSFWYKKPKPTMNVFGEVARLMGVLRNEVKI